MTEPTWESSLKLGVSIIDTQHERQLHLLDELEEAVSAQASQTAVDRLLLELLACTTDHFTTEHEMMSSSRYPDREKHIEDHDRLLHQLSRLLTSHLQRERKLTLELVRSLRPWAIDHIQSMDRPLALCLRAKLGR